MPTLQKWMLGLFLLLATPVWAQPLISKVIELNYLPANQVIELIQPLIKNGEQISGLGQTIVLKVSPQTLTDIRNLIHKIDIAPVTFKITIHQGEADWLKKQGKAVVYSSRSLHKSPINQSVQVMNGQTALVSSEEQIPIIQAAGFGFYTGVIYQQQPVQTGLLIRPIAQGTQVQLTLRRIRQEEQNTRYQQFSEQRIDTTIMAPLNQWISLGAANGMDEEDQSTVYSTSRPFIKNATLYIKITIINP